MAKRKKKGYARVWVFPAVAFTVPYNRSLPCEIRLCNGDKTLASRKTTAECIRKIRKAIRDQHIARERAVFGGSYLAGEIS